MFQVPGILVCPHIYFMTLSLTFHTSRADMTPNCPKGFSPDVKLQFYGSCKECGPSLIPDFTWKLSDDVDSQIRPDEYRSEELVAGTPSVALGFNTFKCQVSFLFFVSLVLLTTRAIFRGRTDSSIQSFLHSSPLLKVLLSIK